MSGHLFHPTILRAYDIRGIVGETLFEADARALGAAFGTLVRRDGGTEVCVGYDGRLSSPLLEAALVEGLASTGLRVLRIGRGPTPLLYFAVKHTQAAAGIMVTGSHNPPTHNGFKMMLQSRSVFGDDIQTLGRLAAQADLEHGAGSIETLSLTEAYVERLLADFTAPHARDLRVVWDAGNGAAGEIMTALAHRLPGHHHLLFADIDGHFPNHHPDPTEPENLEDLRHAVRAQGAHVGLAFDGDGDRLGVIDGAGGILWGDQILMLLAREVLQTHPGATVIADIKASQTLFDEVARLGGVPLMWKTGHSLIKEKMAETGSPLAGEMSGHLFLADRYYGYDDGLYAAIRMLNIVASQPSHDLARLHDSLPKAINTPELRIACPDERKFAVMATITAHLEATGATFSPIDGVRVTTPYGWWLLRASNTQAVLVARCEASTAADLERLRLDVTRHLALGGL